MIKWLKSDFENQRRWELAIALFIGGLVGFVVGGIDSDWIIIKGAKWWDVFSALGTVGAVLVSLSVLAASRLKANKDKKIEATKKVAELKPYLEGITQYSLIGIFGVSSEMQIDELREEKDNFERMLHPLSDVYDIRVNILLRDAIYLASSIEEYYSAQLCTKRECKKYQKTLSEIKEIVTQARQDLGFWWDKKSTLRIGF